MDAPPATHPTDQTLSSYGLGKLDDASAESVNKHLEQCPDCRNRVAEISPDTFLGRLRDAQARPDSPAPIGSSLAGLSMLAGGSPSPAPPPASTLPPGLADHPDYEILRELGRGGMGVVYLAENKLMGRKEVLKVVSSHLLNRKGVLERFLREIRSAAQLHHPNIVTAYSAIRDRREPRLLDGVRRGLRPGQAGRDERARCRWPTPATSSTRRRSGFSTPTSTAWSTATSSRAT